MFPVPAIRLRPAVRAWAVLLAALLACDEDPPTSVGGSGTLQLQLVMPEGQLPEPADAPPAGIFPAPAEVLSHLDSAKVTVTGPAPATTAQTVRLTAQGASFTGTISNLGAGTYSVLVLGYDLNEVDHYGYTGSVAVAANQTATASVTFGSFAPATPPVVPTTSSQFRYNLQWPATTSADSYRVEVSRNSAFTGPGINQTVTTTTAQVTVPDTGQYFLRVRASNPRVAFGRPTPTQSFRVVRNAAEPGDDSQNSATSLGSGLQGTSTFGGLNLFPASDSDWFSVDLCPGDSVNVNARAVRLAVPSPVNTALTLLAPDNTNLGSNDDADSTDARLGHRTTREGPHRIRVSGTTTAVGHYELVVYLQRGAGCSGTNVAQVAVTPGAVVLVGAPGATQQLTAAATDAAGNPVTGKTPSWFSLNPAIASVNPATGLVTTQSAGQTSIGASVDGVVGYAAVTLNTVVGLQAAATWSALNSGQTGALNGIWGLSPNETYWAVGDGGSIRRYTGSSWTSFPSPTGRNLSAVYGFTATDFFAVGVEGTIVRGNADRAVAMISGVSENLHAVWGASPHAVFAVGDAGTILRFNGSAWTRLTSPTTQNLYGVWGTGEQEVYAVGANGTVLLYNGTSWSAMTSGTTQTLYGIWAQAVTGGAFAVGAAGTTLRLSAGSWSSLTSNTTQNLYAVWATSFSDVYAAGAGGTLLRYNGSSWSALTSGTGQQLEAIFGSFGGSVYAVGGNGTALRGTRISGTPAATVRITPSGVTVPSGSTAALSAEALDASGNPIGGKTFTWYAPHPAVASVSATGSSTAQVTGGNAGQAVIQASVDGVTGYALVTGTADGAVPVARWIPASAPAGIGSGVILHSIWGSSQTDVVLGAGNGRVYRYDGTSWTSTLLGSCCGVPAIAGVSPTEVYAAHGGTIFRFDGAQWSATGVGHNQPMTDVWAGSRQAVFAVALDGTIFRYDGNLWTSTPSGATRLHAVWGTSPSNVFAVGTVGVGPAVYRFDGSAWTGQLLPGGLGSVELWDVWGTAGNNVYVVGDGGTILRFNGSTWSRETSGSSSGLHAVWGASASEIYAAGGNPAAVLRFNGTSWTSQSIATGIEDLWGTAGGDPWAVGGSPSVFRGGRVAAAVAVTPAGTSSTAPGTVTLSAQPLDANGNSISRSVSWTTLNPAVLSGSSSSMQAAAHGQAVVGASADGVSGYALVTVSDATAPANSWSAAPNVLPGSHSGIWGTSRSNVWLVSRDNNHFRFNGTIWSAVNIGFPSAEDVWGASADDVYAVGPAGAVAHFDGANWTTINLPGGPSLQAVWGSAPNDVYAVGANGTIAHYDGNGWTVSTVGSANYQDVWGTGRDNVYVVGSAGTILRNTGGGWVAMPSNGSWPDLFAIWGTGPDNLYAVGASGTAIRYTSGAGAWNAMPTATGFTGVSLRDVTGSSAGVVYAVGDGGEIVRFDGNDWRYYAGVTTENLHTVWATPGQEVFVAGDGGAIRHGVRTLSSPPSGPTSLSIVNTSGTAIELAWVDNASTEDGYLVERCNGPAAGCAGNFFVIAQRRAGTITWIDASVTPGSTYTYQVRAYNAVGSSGFTNQAEAVASLNYNGFFGGTTSQSDSVITLAISGNAITAITFGWSFAVSCGTVSGRTTTTFGAPVAVSNGSFSHGPASAGFLSYTISGTFISESQVSGTLSLSYNDSGSCVGSASPTPSWSAVRSTMAPSLLSANPVSSSSIQLAWADNSADETDFRVERCTGPGCVNFAQITTLPANTVNHTDVGLAASTTYRYRIRAAVAGGATSPYSNVAATATPAAPPAAPSNTAASVLSASQIQVTWTDNSGDEEEFRIERCTGGSCTDFAQVGTAGANVTTFTDGGLASGTTYRYQVRSYHAAGGSSTPSAIMSAVTPTPLSSGQVLTDLSGGLDSRANWFVAVPSGQSRLTVTIYGGTGDADLYVRQGGPPTDVTYDCQSIAVGNADQCVINSPPAAEWHIMLEGYSAYSGVALTVSYGSPAWAQLLPTGTPPTATGPAVMDTVGNVMIVFGGLPPAGGGNTNEVTVLNTADGSTATPSWVPLSPSGPNGFPASRHAHGMAYDQANNRLIVFGGCDGGCTPTLNDVWVLTNANGQGGTPTWIPLSPTGTPPAGRAHPAVMYDPGFNRLIVFGGQNGGGSAGATFAEVWVLTNANGLGGTPAWTLLGTTGTMAPGQYAPSAVFDHGANRMTTFGGSAQGSGAPTRAVYAAFNANGTLGSTATWQTLVPESEPSAPSARSLASTGLDRLFNRLIMFGGNGNTDTWILTNANGTSSPSSWSPLSPIGGTPTAYNTAVYRRSSNRLVVYGNASTTNVVWVLTGANGL